MLSIRNNINTDVAIIGAGISSLLAAYVFMEKNIKVAVLAPDMMLEPNESENYSLEKEINTLFSCFNNYNGMEFFPIILESLYVLEGLIEHLDDNCGYVYRPGLTFHSKKNPDKYFIDTPFSRHCEAFINPFKLRQELLKYLCINGVTVFEKNFVTAMDITDHNVKLSVNKDYQVLCKRVLMSDRDMSLLFFDKPAGKTAVFEGNLYNSCINKSPVVYGNDNLVSYKYSYYPFISTNTISYYFNSSLNILDENRAYIDIHKDYPNIYFNIVNDDQCILTAIIGLLCLSAHYIGRENKQLNLLKNIR